MTLNFGQPWLPKKWGLKSIETRFQTFFIQNLVRGRCFQASPALCPTCNTYNTSAMHFKIRFLLQYSFHFVAARKKTDRKSPETRFEEVFLAELIWRLVPGVSPNYTTSEMPAKFRFQWHYSFGLSEKKQVLVSTYFFLQPEFAKRSPKTHFRASSARNWVIGLLLASTWWKYCECRLPLILAIINIDRAVSNPVVHTQRDEMILEDGRTETPCSLNETSSKFRVVTCADGCMYVQT